MAANPKRLTYRLLSRGRLLLALTIGALFIYVYVSPLQKWSAFRTVLIYLQFTATLLLPGSLFCLAFLVIAALAGRWYCSVLCPFGTLQEAVWRTGRLLSGRKTKFISPWRLRYIVPVLMGIGIVAANQFLLMDPFE